MKQSRVLKDGWQLIKLDSPCEELDAGMLSSFQAGTDDAVAIREMPAQVHDVLLQNGRISDEILVGWCKSVIWVGKSDWVYRCSFDCDTSGNRLYLRFLGLDTLADIYLNGRLMARHDDFFLPERIEISDVVQRENILLLHFHNTYDYLDKLEMPREWDGIVSKFRLMRKPQHDFPVKTITDAVDNVEGSSYQGANPYHTPIGIYGEVVLETIERAEVTSDWLRTSLSEDYSKGIFKLDLDVDGRLANGFFKIKVLAAGTKIIAGAELPLISYAGDKWQGFCELEIPAPLLWWPRGFGEQHLYTVQVDIYDGGFLCDTYVRMFGFKDVKTSGNLDFVINGKVVRLWGGSMDPFQGLTHCWRDDRVQRMLDMVENANMNTLRIWGEGIPYDDRFYEACDRRGILVWQEFFMGYGYYPDSLKYRSKFRAEAEHLIRRVRHHASLLMWCGGNESRMGAEYEGMDHPFFGEKMQTEDFPELLSKLDPGRYYHESSPSGKGGRWANDPLVGDYHTYDCVWQYPGSEYPNFTSEDIHTAPPVMHSLKKFVRQENFWPAGYSGKLTSRDRYPLPDAWMERVCIGANMHLKTGPIWEYYDADTPEEMLYRFGAAYGQTLRDSIERIRMGSREGGLYREQRSKGHFSCKLNDTWPKIYCAVIDYFQEGYIPYYATKQAQEPVLVCFDIRTETIQLWLINDSSRDIRGSVTFKLFSLPENRFVRENTVDAFMPQGCSDIVLNLDFLLFFRKYHLLYACFKDEAGKVVNYAIDFVDIERHLSFPDARLEVQVEGNELQITSDSFARCVEISGNDNGDEFGWLFEDNYFDLIPGDIKRVRILGRHKSGKVKINPHYSNRAVEIDYAHEFEEERQ